MEQSLKAHSMSSVMEEVRRLKNRDARTVSSKDDGLVSAFDREGQAGLLASGSGGKQRSHLRREEAAVEQRVVQAGARALVGGSEDVAYKAGKMPNFAALHASWARRLAAAKAAVQRGLTIPKV